MNNQLQNTLRSYLQTDWESNPAMRQIIHGYAQYHAVIAVAASIFLIAILWLSIRFWKKFRTLPKISRFQWPFEKKMYFCFASLFTFVVLFLALITAANIITASKPMPGLTGAVDSLSDNSFNKKSHDAFNDWIVSGNTTPPKLVQQSISRRREFHIYRVILSCVLLIVFTLLSVKVWGKLLVQRSEDAPIWKLRDISWVALGTVSVTLALLMMIVFMANLQSAIVPIANTVQFG